MKSHITKAAAFCWLQLLKKRENKISRVWVQYKKLKGFKKLHVVFFGYIIFLGKYFCDIFCLISNFFFIFHCVNWNKFTTCILHQGVYDCAKYKAHNVLHLPIMHISITAAEVLLWPLAKKSNTAGQGGPT